ncbi:MAG: 3-phosphoshikimate 1-carboxyvinyltransferase [bacterium]
MPNPFPRFQDVYTELAGRASRRVCVEAGAELRGELQAPPSKSYTHRALMVAGLATGGIVDAPLLSADTAATAAVWEALGATVTYDAERRQAHVFGFDGRPRPRDPDLYVHEAGTLFRFVLPGLALAEGTFTLAGNDSFNRRANDVIVRPLRDLGIDVTGQGETHRAPVTVHGTGRIVPGVAHVPGGKSSQAVSGLLLWLPLATAASGEGEGRTASEIVIDGTPVSGPYVDMTIEVLEWGGIAVETLSAAHWRVPSDQRYRLRSSSYRVPGDYSSAAFLLAAACLVPSDVWVRGLRDDQQGDRKIVTILRDMGAAIERDGDGFRVRGPARLRGIEIDCAATPDLVPILAALGCHATGRTVLANLLHLRNKESDRIAAPVTELGKLGGRLTANDDSIVIEGSALTGGVVDSWNDHRMAMSLAVAGLPAGGVEIEGAESVLKSYPTFFDDLSALGALLIDS